ncbi:glycosyl hydrolase [Nocardioides sp. SYSU DS0663]|uniref:glycosyl hydrolase n=1 Tax=Nocardioides sp. SYSU DS0663 TaxID=3416445 RepID=UPI003F4B3FF0
MPLAFTDDEVLREELRDIAAAGGGGVEVAPFVVPGPGNQSNAFLAEYGWGTPLWAHKMEVITSEAADLGLIVDQNLGPHYPPTVPTLNSFNQPQAEQQLIYGREFNEPGSSRTGALPAPTTAPPSVTTQLCGVAAPGDEVLKVASLGGFARGDKITVGAGPTAEEVVVTGLGDRTATCADLSVSAVTNAHAVAEPVKNVARSTRIRTLVAQCAEGCDASSTDPIKLVPGSVADVTDKVTRGNLEHTFATGNGNPWVVIDLLQVASGLVAQRGGFTATQPNYVVDHWSRGGVNIQTNFWDEHVLTDAVRKNLDRIGQGAIFEDSLELGETQKWTWGFLREFEKRRGYDPTTLLPALAGIGIQGTHAPAFELEGVGDQVREDYRQTLSDLFAQKYVAPMQRWAASHGLDFRIQPYGIPAASGVAAGKAGIVEGESLNFGASSNTFGAEQDYRVLASGARLNRQDIVSVECCAVFMGNYRSSVAGPSVPGQFNEGGDGTQVGGKFSNGLLDAVYKSYAGGVNQLVWHGYPYRDAPADPATGRDGSWPGYHPWDIFNVLNVNDEFGPRQPNWPDYKRINDNLARTQLVLRQGRGTVDLAVYYEDLGLAGASVGVQQPTKHMLGTDSATATAGYTYDYVAPDFLTEPGIVEPDGGLFGDRTDQEALVLNNQTTMSVENAEQLLELAKNGLRVFVVGTAPQKTTGAHSNGDRLRSVIDALLDQPNVVTVGKEAGLPAALRAAGIKPTVTPRKSGAALGAVRREAAGVTYDFVYNRTGKVVNEKLTLAGTGTPYRLNTWTGRIEPIGEYTTKAGATTVEVRVAPYDKVVIALAKKSARLGPRPALHATSSSAEVAGATKRTLVLRATSNGRYTTRLSNGSKRTTKVRGLAASQDLDTWTLTAQTWTPGANQYTTVKTDQPGVTVTAGEDGKLPSWREILAPVNLATSSGVGTYAATVTLPKSWKSKDGAYLDLGDVIDTVSVTVNGKGVVVNQSDRGRIDLGKALDAGKNTVVVRVATTMFNAVRASGDSNYQMQEWQRTGLLGPVVLDPYRDTVVKTRGKRR